MFLRFQSCVLSLLLVFSVAVASAQDNANPAKAADTRRQGSEFMGAATRAMQRDDTQNPAMLWVKDGEALWSQAPANGGKSCAACHGDAQKSMRGVATRYPAFDSIAKRPIDLAQRINLCREGQQKAPAWKLESQELLAMESYLALQSRGMPVQASSDPRLQPHLNNGERIYQQRMGQLNLSCAQCHDANAGRHLGSAVIPQAHPTGYPVYRLEWQTVGSLQRRLRNCLTGVRAEAWAPGAVELVELELYLTHRARGMALEAPGVRP